VTAPPETPARWPEFGDFGVVRLAGLAGGGGPAMCGSRSGEPGADSTMELTGRQPPRLGPARPASALAAGPENGPVSM
jgi:hypothetical protein